MVPQLRFVTQDAYGYRLRKLTRSMMRHMLASEAAVSDRAIPNVEGLPERVANLCRRAVRRVSSAHMASMMTLKAALGRIAFCASVSSG